MANARPPLGWKEVAAALLVLAVYAIGLYRLPTHTFWSPDEGGKYLQAESLRWKGGIEFVLPYAGEGLDPQLRFYAYRPWGDRDTFIVPMRAPDGELRFHWPLWFTYLAKLPVVALGPAGGYVIALLAGWLAVIVAGLLAREIDSDLGAPAILVVGLATPIWFYSLCFWEHTAAVALGMAGVYAVVRGDGRAGSWLIAAACAVGSVMMRIEMMAFVVAMIIVGAGWAVARIWLRARGGASDGGNSGWRTWAPVAAVVIALAVLAGISLTSRHQEVLLTVPQRLTRLARVPGALGGILAAPYWSGTLLLEYAGARAGLMSLIACSIAPLFRGIWIEAALTVIGMIGFALYSGSLVSAPGLYRSLHGVFPIAPFMVLAAHGLREAWDRRTSKGLVLSAATLAYFGAGIAGLGMVYIDEGAKLSLGLAWGQRYLLLVYPLLTLLALVGVRAYWRSKRPRALRISVVALAVVLVGIGVAFELRGLDESRRTRLMLARWEQAIEGERIILTDIWWLPAALAELYTRKPMFVVDRRAEVAEWIEATAGTAGYRFTFASLRPIHLSDFSETRRRLMRRSDQVVDGLYLTEVSFSPRRDDRTRR